MSVVYANTHTKKETARQRGIKRGKEAYRQSLLSRRVFSATFGEKKTKEALKMLSAMASENNDAHKN